MEGCCIGLQGLGSFDASQPRLFRGVHNLIKLHYEDLNIIEDGNIRYQRTTEGYCNLLRRKEPA